MKKALLIMLTAIVLSLSVLTLSASARGDNTDCFYLEGNNFGSQYDWPNYASPIEAYLVECDNGNLMRVQSHTDYSGNRVIFAEYYDSNFNFISRRIIEEELPIFGGFYSTDEYYFILSGQENPEEYENLEVIRLTKYDKSWNRLSSVGLSDCNTTTPFRAGSARFAHIGDVLLVRSSHRMYKSSDGLNHQANITIKYDIKNMSVISSAHLVSNSYYGYVSHSFNQFVRVHNNNFVAVDHGDAYPRSVALFEYKNAFNGGQGRTDRYDLLEIPGEIGDNYTGCQVGGFEISSSAYLVAGSVVDYDDYENSSTRNIFISVLPFSTKTPQLKKLTDYPEGTLSASSPHLVKISEDRFLILWERGYEVSYILVDGNGNKLSQEYTIEGRISDCEPIIYNNKVVWYTYNNEFLHFYEIDTDDVSADDCTELCFGHRYSVSSCNGNTVTVKCSTCNDVVTGEISEFDLFWSVGDGWFSTNPGNIHPGTETEFYVAAYYGDFDDYNISVSDTTVGEFCINPDDPDRYIFKAKKIGETVVTVSSVYNPQIKTSYTVTVDHIYKEKSSQKPTCTSDGYTVYGCTYCGDTYKSTDKAYGHSYWDEYVKYATCTSDGYTVYECAYCGDTYKSTDKAYGHSYRAEYSKDVTCTTDGYKEYCCVNCGDSYEIVVEAKGHSYKTKVTKEATYAKKGEKKKTCQKCGYVKKESIAKKELPMIKGLKAKKIKVAKSSEITLSWTGIGEGVKYEVYRKNGKKWKKIKTTDKTSYTVKKLKAGKEYQFRVRAVVDSANGDYSKTLTVETVPETASLKLKAGKKQLTASWKSVSGVSGYEVQYSTSKKFSKKTTKKTTVKSSSKSTKVKKLKEGKKYYVRVRTYKTVDGKKVYSSWSKVKNVKVK